MRPKLAALLPVLLVALLWVAVPPALARERLSIVRDAEIEATLKDFARPVLVAAGLDPEAVRFVLIDRNVINAFVAEGQNIFVFSGLILKSQSAGEVVGVIAHETGHIAGGHLVRSKEAVENASTEAILAAILGVGAAIASGDSQAGAAVFSGGVEVARRNLLAYSRAQESAADQAGLTFLDRARLPKEGMVTFMERLADDEFLPEDRRTEYVRTHPLSSDRVETLRATAARMAATGARQPADWDERFRRMQAKLLGFVQPRPALTRFEGATDFAGRYGRAIALYRTGDVAAALDVLEGLLGAEPENPYLHELKGQILLENQRGAEALAPYARAVALAPEVGVLRIAYGHALAQSRRPQDLDAAIEQLVLAQRDERRSVDLWRHLGAAYALRGDEAMAQLATAEAAILRRDKDLARSLAARAEKGLQPGTPAHLRAQDLLAELGPEGKGPRRRP